jgi:hypothetical protein
VGRGDIWESVWGGEEKRRRRRLTSLGSEGAAARVAPSRLKAAVALIPGNHSVSWKMRERGGPIGPEGRMGLRLAAKIKEN